MNDNPESKTKQPEDVLGAEVREAMSGLMNFLTDQLTEEEQRHEAVVRKIAAMPVRERQLIQEAAIAGYLLGYVDRHENRRGIEDSVRVTARAVDRCLQEPDNFIAMAADPNTSDSMAEQHNQQLQRQLDATVKAKQENDERFQLERDQARMELAELREQLRAGEASDGNHTHNELYRYRMLYNAHAAQGWMRDGISVVKSKRHHNGEECFGGGWFIVTAQLSTGQVSNHYELEHWDLFDVPERRNAPVWDGHSPADAALRMAGALM